MAGNVECPNGGECNPQCAGFQEACGLSEWKAQHPLPDIPRGLKPLQQRLAQSRRKRVVGTHTFMTDTTRGMIGRRCDNKKAK